MSTRSPLPPFTQESATLKVRLAEDGWNSRDPEKVALAYTVDSRWHDDSGNWFRSYGNENWEFDNDGLMRLRLASINDLSIEETERKYHWPLGRRPDEHPGLSDLGFQRRFDGTFGPSSRRQNSRPKSLIGGAGCANI